MINIATNYHFQFWSAIAYNQLHRMDHFVNEVKCGGARAEWRAMKVTLYEPYHSEKCVFQRSET